MTAVIYHKQLKYDGKEWKVPVPITIPSTPVLAGQETTVFTPTAGFAVIDTLVLVNTDTANPTNVTIKDGNTVIATIPLNAGETKVVPIKIVVKNSLVISSDTTNIVVFGSGEDYHELIE